MNGLCGTGGPLPVKRDKEGVGQEKTSCYQTEAAHCEASISGRGRPQGVCVELNDQSPGGNVENSPKGVRCSVKPGRRWVPELLTKQGGADHYPPTRRGHLPKPVGVEAGPKLEGGPSISQTSKSKGDQCQNQLGQSEPPVQCVHHLVHPH